MARKNLKGNPSFADGTTDYAVFNGAAISVTTDYSFYGPQALVVEKSDSNYSGVLSTDPIPVVAGLPYAFSAYVRLPNTLPVTEDANIVLRAEWRNSVNTVVTTNESALLELDQDDSWERLSAVWTAPVGATVVFIQIAQPEGGTDGAVFILDAILVEQSSYVGGYVNNFTQAEENKIVNKALTKVAPQVINGMALNADVSINDLVLNTIDENGTVWVCTDIQGWWGNAMPESPDIPRGTEDGSYDVSGRYQARIITLTGVFIPSSIENLGACRDRLVEAIDLVRKGGWLRTNENPTKAAYVRLSGLPQIQTVNARGRTEFMVGFRAGDPIKYEWDDADPDGFSWFNLSGADTIGTLVNNGTATVTGVLTLTGPMGAGSTVYNALTDETLTIIEPLRGEGIVGTVSSASVTDGVATLKTTEYHGLREGDKIIVSGVSLVYDTIGFEATVIGASDIYPYSINYAIASDDLEETVVGGQVILARNDELTIDTYNREVSFNGSNVGHRAKLETLTDWIKFAPGDNTLEFFDDIDVVPIVTKSLTSNVVTLTSSEIHYIQPGTEVSVELPETALLSKKSLTSNVVTLTTQTPHGYSVGDLIDVSTVAESVIDQKSASTTVATLRTVDTHGIGAGDTIVVNLPASAAPSAKSLTSNVATITTLQPHGFSAGDSVTITLPTAATVTNKALTSNQATLTTSAAHGFSVGDSMTVALPTTATITNKERLGAQARMTTSAPHGFSVGDSITMAFPASATLTNTRSIADGTGGYLVTVNTSGAHNFSVGDLISVNIGVTATLSVTNRESSGTTRTLTIGTNGFSVGEKVTVSGINASYNGTFYISARTATTISYVAAAALTESITASAGSVLNVTIQSYYNGSGKVIESVPTSTSLTYRAYSQEVATSSTATGTGATLSDTTNSALNGVKTILSTTSTTFTYNI